jgi:hypothetical protein
VEYRDVLEMTQVADIPVIELNLDNVEAKMLWTRSTLVEVGEGTAPENFSFLFGYRVISGNKCSFAAGTYLDEDQDFLVFSDQIELAMTMPPVVVEQSIALVAAEPISGITLGSGTGFLLRGEGAGLSGFLPVEQSPNPLLHGGQIHSAFVTELFAGDYSENRDRAIRMRLSEWGVEVRSYSELSVSRE